MPGRWYQGHRAGVAARRRPASRSASEVYTLDAEGIAWTRRSEPASLLKRGDVAWFRLEVPETKKDKDGKARSEEKDAGEGRAAGSRCELG